MYILALLAGFGSAQHSLHGHAVDEGETCGAGIGIEIIRILHSV
jgi:hypothetical protein